ncbi:MAG: MBL fold metallo-hydrolase [Actinobacteria bacterium]|nr:MBL fold metallo-hydrolase [Actinomycetota bacterium]
MFSFDKKGIKVNNSDFWLDANRKTDFSFISHGHADHLRNHLKVLGTPATVRFHEWRAKQRQAVPLDFGEIYDWDGLQIQLFPAGHILGSAMIRVERDGVSLLYTGDFKMKPSWTAEQIEIPQADILIMESTFGSPEYIFNSSRESLADDLSRFINDCFQRGMTPVVLAYALGKAQEAMKIIGDRDYSVRVHRSAWDISRIYEDFGVTFKNCALWREGNVAPGEVLVLPPHLARTRKVLTLHKKRTVLLSGWAKSSNGFHYRADHAIPMSDHADFNDLFAFVKKVNPKQIYTTHGFDEFPKHLRAIGFDAQLLKPTDQTELF